MSETKIRDVHRLPSEPIRGPAALPEPRRLGADGYPDEHDGARRVAPRISFPHLWRPSPPHRYVVCASACAVLASSFLSLMLDSPPPPSCKWTPTDCAGLSDNKCLLTSQCTWALDLRAILPGARVGSVHACDPCLHASCVAALCATAVCMLAQFAYARQVRADHHVDTKASNRNYTARSSFNCHQPPPRLLFIGL